MPDALSSEFVALQQAVAGRYSLERELGRGGMGIVFLARDVTLDRLVAIKLLPPEQAAQAGLKDRFLREARTAAGLSHPNIVPIHVVEEAQGLVFFVMAYVEGETLGQRLRTRGPLSPAAGARLLQEVAWALAYAHARGIVHRDVKPDNILIEQGTGRAMMSDFGIARAGGGGGGGTGVGEIIGTAQYMSPEQASGEAVDGRSDIYALGIVGFYTLSGKLPFDAPDVAALLAMQITRPAAPLSSVAPGVPARTAQAIDRCLAKIPDDRWSTGEAFAEALVQSTAVVREIPAPIRAWITRGQGARPLLYLWFAALADGALISVIEGVSPAVPLGLLVASAGVFLLNRLYRMHQVLAVGFTVDDVRVALRQHIEHRAEELAFERDYDREPPWWAKALRWTTFGLFGVSAVSFLALLTIANPGNVTRIALTFALSTAAGLGGTFLGWIWPGRKVAARDRALEFRLKLLEGPIGRFLTRLAGLGLRGRALPAPGSHRPTELAIGMAADQIFESLPKEARKELKDLPNLVRRLEAEAQGMRARVDELNAMIAGLGDEALSAKSASLRERGAGAVVGDQREQVRNELSAKRDQAAQRLSVSVAALENIRLDLLRLKAGVGTVDQLTADLDAARDLQAEINLAIESRREVEAALRPAGGAAE